MHEHCIIYVLIKGIYHQSHHGYKTSTNQHDKTCGISQTNYVDHIVYANHKDCNFDNKISIPKAEPEAPESDMVLCCCSRPARCSAATITLVPLAPGRSRAAPSPE